MKDHYYSANVTWTGDAGQGTKSYTSYKRDHIINIEGKPPIPGSSDRNFRGDITRYIPEDLLLASVSACHMLWFLHLCSAAGIIVTGYDDNAEGTMVETDDGGGHFTRIILKPNITLPDDTWVAKANELHQEANRLCFIANSCNFPILHKATYQFG